MSRSEGPRSGGPADADASGESRGLQLPSDDLLESLGFFEVVSVDREAGRVRLAFDALPRFCHSDGRIVQGGFVTSMLDAAMAHAITARIGTGMMVPTLDLNVSFFRVCNPGPHFSEGSVVHCTRSVAFAEALLTDASGTPIARATATCKVAPLKG